MSIASNKKAYFDYEIIKKFEAGIVLNGNEIKSVRLKNVNLKDSYVKINYKGELFLYNAHISEYKMAHTISINDSRRARKLLMHKKEITKLQNEVKQQSLAIVPLKMYFKHNYVKVEIALAKGKKNYDKRKAMKEKTINREIDKQLKNYR